MKKLKLFFRNGLNNLKEFFKNYSKLVFKSKVNIGLLLFFVTTGIVELFVDLRGGLIFLTFVLSVFMYFTEYWKNKYYINKKDD